MNKRDALRALMTDYAVDAEAVAKLLRVQPGTVHTWLSSGQTRAIPDRQLQLLELLLQAGQ